MESARPAVTAEMMSFMLTSILNLFRAQTMEIYSNRWDLAFIITLLFTPKILLLEMNLEL